jgi:hypothetical protein
VRLRFRSKKKRKKEEVGVGVRIWVRGGVWCDVIRKEVIGRKWGILQTMYQENTQYNQTFHDSIYSLRSKLRGNFFKSLRVMEKFRDQHTMTTHRSQMDWQIAVYRFFCQTSAARVCGNDCIAGLLVVKHSGMVKGAHYIIKRKGDWPKGTRFGHEGPTATATRSQINLFQLTATQASSGGSRLMIALRVAALT